MEQATAHPSATITLSHDTLARIRALGGATDEATINSALDAYDKLIEDSLDNQRFWAQADAAAAWEAALPYEEREALRAREAEVDAAFNGIG